MLASQGKAKGVGGADETLERLPLLRGGPLLCYSRLTYKESFG